jgi:hypothetical protein
VVTIWPPQKGCAGVNTLARLVPADDDGDGVGNRTVGVPTPVFHALNLLSTLGPDYWVLPSQQVGGHALGGFASRDANGVIRGALFCHHADDIQSRSDHAFRVTLDLAGAGGEESVRVTEHRFDREHNSYFGDAVALRDRSITTANSEEVEALTRILEEGDPAALREAFKKIKKLDPGGLRAIAPAFLQMAAGLTDPKLREEAQTVMQGLFASAVASQPGYLPQTVEKIRKLAELSPTDVTTLRRGPDGNLHLKIPLSGNGLNFFVIEPVGPNG